MSHYEERLEKDLTRIRERVEAMTNQAKDAIKNAVHALLTSNEKLAYATILNDHSINRTMREIDRLCHAFIARHLPSAGHLRLISSIIRANIELERIGDYGVTISREAVQLSSPPEGTVARELERVANETSRMLDRAIAAFNEDNAALAKATMGMADQMEQDLDGVYAELMSEGDRRKVKDFLAMFVVFNMLKRVSDQAKNICEETVFAVTGETKAPLVYRILFLDEHNGCQSQMAEAIARKTFPNSGSYSSAGQQPADTLNETMVDFLKQRSFDLSRARPRGLELTPQELADHHVIVSLEGPVRSYIPQVPFHTSALEWEVGPVPTDLDEQQSAQRLEEMYREISVQIRDLMETLRGEDAS